MDVPEGHDFKEYLNPESLTELSSCRLEPCMKDAATGTGYQFERLGYFCVDKDSTPQMPVFNRTVNLKDTWGKVQKSQNE
jgi:glutaminyl-tRNA synthetase